MIHVDDRAATEYVYAWAQGKLSTKECKRLVSLVGFNIDFRQPDLGGFMEAFNMVTGEYVLIEI